MNFRSDIVNAREVNAGPFGYRVTAYVRSLDAAGIAKVALNDVGIEGEGIVVPAEDREYTVPYESRQFVVGPSGIVNGGCS